MNYRHAFHAGNFADVVKHATLARVIARLKEKPAAFRMIDTHAGLGLYDLTGPEASRTGEWRAGIGKLRAAKLDPAVRELLAPYLDAIAALNPDGKLATYPGSPVLAQRWLRTQDRLVCCELVPQAAEALQAQTRRDARVKVVEIDGYTALNAYVPPKERRGLVLVDPPFETPDEFERLAEALAGAHRKWPTGIYMLWYPLKDTRETERFARRLQALAIPRILRAELTMARAGSSERLAGSSERLAGSSERLAGSGLIVINPPWRLDDELAVLLPALATALAADGRARIDWLALEK
jgi:23S rRNA (adenine2030-N6)-methyltransferase